MRNDPAKLILSAALALGLGVPSRAQVTQAPIIHKARQARTSPVPPRIKGLSLPRPMDQTLAQAPLWDLRNGMVVVVEAQAQLPRWPGQTGSFRIFRPLSALPYDLTPPPGMDPAKVIAEGNTVGQVYPLGWGY